VASSKTSSNKKKVTKGKNGSVANRSSTSKRGRRGSTSAKTSSKTRSQKSKSVAIQEITEQISILEVMSDSAIAAKPFLLVFASIFCMYLGLALFSFDPNDINILTTGDVSNVCGVLGVILSTKLYSMFGYGSWIVLPMGALCSWMAAGRKLLSPSKMFGVGLLYWNLLCVLSLLNSSSTELGFFSGGVLGHATVVTMTKLIGTGGAWLLLSGLAVTVFIFVAGMELREIVERSLQRLEERGPDLGQRSLHWGQEVLEHLKDSSMRWADSIKNKMSRSSVEEQDDWYDDSFFETGSVYTEYTDDGVEFTEEESLPPNSFEHSSEYEPESEFSEDYSYDYHTRELDSDVTKTQVQNREVAQVEFSESFAGPVDESTFDPNPIARQPEPVRISSVSVQNTISEETLTDQSTSPVGVHQPKINRHHTDAFNPFESSPLKSSTKASNGKHHLPEQEEIDLPEDAWEEDLSEWYLTDRRSPMTSSLSVSKQKMSALPPEPLISRLSIRRPQMSEPEVGSVAEHLMADGDTDGFSELNGEISSEEGLYDLPKPIAPSSNVSSNVQTRSKVEKRRDSIEESFNTSSVKESSETFERNVLQRTDSNEHQNVSLDTGGSSKPNSVSQLVDQVEDLKSQAREMAAQQSVPSSKILLPERELTPAMGMEVHADLEDDSEDDFIEATPARALVTPGNIESGGRGEVKELPNPYADFVLPSLEMLDFHKKDVAKYNEDELMELADTLVDKLADFKVHGEVETICPGPVITTFEFKPARGVRVAKIGTLSDDIAMALRAVSVRIVAPIPGKDVVGIEIPNLERQTIWSRDMLGSKVFQESKAILPMAIGKDVNGFPYVTDLTKTPHLLVAGTTGSGKSVGVNTMLISMLLRHSPETLRLILVDPKMLEFEMYNDIPHLLHPVVTDPHQATGILQWACNEMDRRYGIMAKFKTRNIESFNQRLDEEMSDWDQSKAVYFAPDNWDGKSRLPKPKKMPYIVVVIDELADLMMVAGKEVEESIIRIAQKARACGIHLIVATQRPSADVITGLIKANMPSRICFQVRSRSDSRIILDNPGGETLLGKGDMLYLPPGTANLIRCHGPFLTDGEVRRITDHLRAQGRPSFEAEVITPSETKGGSNDYDELYDKAIEFVCEKGYASTSAVQRQFRIGYNRAARMIEQMEADGIISEQNGSKKRNILRNALDHGSQ
jgi:DNA segregation ATPase FtsK/SpoIIIE-like protein